MTFICDSFAWLFGMLFGKGNRGLIKVSPNKSIAGFIGGIFGSILIALLTQHFFPQILPGHFYKAIILGFVVSIFAIIGDLSESLLKRSADCKDSGKKGIHGPFRSETGQGTSERDLEGGIRLWLNTTRSWSI